jgi:Mitochondrial K+-H+ exchange-related
MNVYLVPASGGRHELYCEVASSASAEASGGGSIRERLVNRFNRMVAEGEAAVHGHGQDGPERGRVRRFITRRIAEAVSEQRLLWHLRHETDVRLVHPDDLPPATATSTARSLIAADYAKHRRWCIIDGLVAAITGPLFFFVPGPNIVSWYFAFRAIGHFFAMRGADQALSRATWTAEPSNALTALRAVLALDHDARSRRVGEIAAALGLNRLSWFVEKIA